MRLVSILLFSFLVFGFENIYAQCVSNTPFLGPDTAICNSASIDIDGPSGYLQYDWSTGSSANTINITNPDTYWCAASRMDTTNLIANGDFSMGDTLFSTGHLYGSGGAWGLLSNAGTYAISTNASLTHSNFPICGDHTSGTGKYMIVNGSSVANLAVWCQTITIKPSTTYYFSAWITSIVASSPAILSFTVDGVSMGANHNLTATTCFWQNYFQTWTSGATQTTATICITNQNTAGGGNDFGLDDLFFAEECTRIDSLILTTIPLPVIPLGPDTTICLGDSVHLDVSDSSISTYIWSNNNTSPTLSIYTDSTVSVTVTTGSCSDSATKQVYVTTPPQINLGGDTLICLGNSLFLNAYYPQSTYIWSTGSTNNSIVTTTDSLYWVVTTNNCGSDTDSIHLGIDSPLNVDIGEDTVLCTGESITLSSNEIGASYQWNNGSNQPQTLVTSPYVYILTVTNGCGDFIDSITVDYDNTPITYLGPDHLYCINQLVTLSTSWSRATFLWNNGQTDSSILATNSGNYSVQVTNLCGFDNDTINIMYDIPIPINLGWDTIICKGDSITFSLTNLGYDYTWQDGTIDSTYIVHTSGTYFVSAQNQCGIFTDSINVAPRELPLLPYPISDTLFCEGDGFTVSIGKFNSDTILWMDQYPHYTRDIQLSNHYIYSLINICGSTSDSFIVIADTPVVASLGNDTIFCYGEPIVKSFDIPNHSYYWSTGETDSIKQFTETGLYGVTIVSPGNCETYTEFEITSCETQLFIPNAFTPGNMDELNPTFHVQGVGIRKYRIVIYDRWGTEIFGSTDLSQPWGGDINGEPAASGVYSYKIWYNTGLTSESVIRIGELHLIR